MTIKGIKKRSGYRCSRCHILIGYEQRSKLHIHHKNRNENDNAPTNLEVLCCSCHRIVHGVIRQFTPDGKLVKEYASIKEAAQLTGYPEEVLRSLIRDGVSPAMNFKWERVLPEPEDTSNKVL